jgi:hypothetical protein
LAYRSVSPSVRAVTSISSQRTSRTPWTGGHDRITDFETGLGPPDPVLTTVDSAGRCDVTNARTDVGSSATVQVL